MDGGGGNQPTQQTNTASTVPAYAQPYMEDLLGRAQAPADGLAFDGLEVDATPIILDLQHQVVALLESEANQDDPTDKFNRVDLLVQDGQGVALRRRCAGSVDRSLAGCRQAGNGREDSRGLHEPRSRGARVPPRAIGRDLSKTSFAPQKCV